MRVYQLSKELGLNNQETLVAARKLSIQVTSHNSTINEEQASQIRDHLKEIVHNEKSHLVNTKEVSIESQTSEEIQQNLKSFSSKYYLKTREKKKRR